MKTTQKLYDLLCACADGKKPDDWLFTRPDGSRVLDFRGARAIACAKAGVPVLKVHDLRGTGVRNMRRLGIPESVATEISGHKTPSVFKRDDIVDAGDLADAVARLDVRDIKQKQAQAQQERQMNTVRTQFPPMQSQSTS